MVVNGMRQGGVTLPELLVTLSIAGLLVTVALPSFEDFIIENELASQANAFVRDIHLARSEAVKRGSRVVLCKKNADGTDCISSGGYEQGWIVFVDGDNDALVTGDDLILRVAEELPAGMTLTSNSQNSENYLSYTVDGIPRTAGGGPGALQMSTLTLEKIAKVPRRLRCIILSSGGRVKVEKPEDPDKGC